jgi:hypothetical protein
MQLSIKDSNVGSLDPIQHYVAFDPASPLTPQLPLSLTLFLGCHSERSEESPHRSNLPRRS